MGVEGGSIQPLVRAGCLVRVMGERAKALNGYLTGEEGEVSCAGRFGA